MKDLTKDFERLCNARREVAIFSGCEDGSAECAEYQYETQLANFKHNIEGKNWVLTNGNLITSGNSYTSLLEEEIKKWDYRNSYNFEVEE